ncbi:MAG: ComF family protein, partial [Verrucomicrobiales bacterium]|nr:ComF family protein [Verrucomicrobiales bacterium]
SLISVVWRDERLLRDSWVVVPVPLHPKRLRERGFNQSREIAVEMMRCAPPGIELEMCDLLRRTRHTVRQAQLDREDRLRNPDGAFELKSYRLVKRLEDEEKELNLLLVDDVMTTGSTVSECASVLREALEPDRIAAVSVLRG